MGFRGGGVKYPSRDRVKRTDKQRLNKLKSKKNEGKIIFALIQGTDKDQANSAERTINISGKLNEHKYFEIV